MNGRNLVLGALAAFVAMFALSWVWHEALMADFYQSVEMQNARESPLIWSVAAGYGLLALLMAWIFPKGYEGGTSWVEGMKFGAVIGILWILPLELVLYGVLEGSFSHVAVDGAWHVVEQGLGGIALGMVYGGGETEAAEAPAPRPERQDPRSQGQDTSSF